MSGRAAAICAVASPMPKPISSTSGARATEDRRRIHRRSGIGQHEARAQLLQRTLLAAAHATGAQHVAAQGAGGMRGAGRRRFVVVHA